MNRLSPQRRHRTRLLLSRSTAPLGAMLEHGGPLPGTSWLMRQFVMANSGDAFASLKRPRKRPWWEILFGRRTR
jgi:hypothetical protein